MVVSSKTDSDENPVTDFSVFFLGYEIPPARIRLISFGMYYHFLPIIHILYLIWYPT